MVQQLAAQVLHKPLRYRVQVSQLSTLTMEMCDLMLRSPRMLAKTAFDTPVL
jgi:hypothetical protein